METESILQKCNGRSVEQLKYTDTYQLLPSVTKWRQISNSKRNLFKNCDMSEISICLQPNQRGCCSFTILKNDTRLLGQKQRTLILSAQQEEGLQVSLSRPCPLPSPRGRAAQQMLHTGQPCVPDEETQGFKRKPCQTSNRAASLTSLCPQENTAFIMPDSKQICPLPKEGSLFLFQGCLL